MEILGQRYCYNLFMVYSNSKETLYSISDRLDVRESTVHKTIRRIAIAVIEIVLPEIIVLAGWNAFLSSEKSFCFS